MKDVVALWDAAVHVFVLRLLVVDRLRQDRPASVHLLDVDVQVRVVVRTVQSQGRTEKEKEEITRETLGV